MKTDRELLELAARAAEMGELVYLSETERYAVVWLPLGADKNEWVFWNPLTDDGDALRLALKLGLCITFIADCDTVQVFQQNEYAEASNVKTEAMDNEGTRRAIVRAAAAIGESMK